MIRPNFRMAACLAVVCLAAASPALAAQPAARPDRSAALDTMIDKAMAENPCIPAMAVLVIRDGKVAEQAVRGVRASDAPDKAQANDIWHIGSDAKAMTATMIARLVDRGVLSWSAPLKTMLPGVSMRPEYESVTLADLLSHRAGLRDLDDTADAAMIEAAFVDTRPLPQQRLAFAGVVLNEAPIGPARGESAYSNSDYLLAAAVAEQATGKSFEQLMQDEVFHPLGMSVVYAPSERGQVLGHREGKPLTGIRADNPPLFAPAGAVKLSMGDWARFAIDQMAGEKGRGALLPAAAYSTLHTPQGDTASALGWGVRNTWPAKAPIRLLMHAGSNGYWDALIALAPDSEGGVLIVANGGGDEVEGVQTGILMTLMADVAASAAR
ncbi:serine hydrolase [Phenylobacterium sp. Root700]|uniref:serine hydrolase domain-containing protein n=1 Tax=Phenylobacterium sp. Root700 TaxID=1736591 RepID=UPI0009E9D5E4|nr:serine hydrolase domain-containing protein [Phenylobacterium sp. Root700]